MCAFLRIRGGGKVCNLFAWSFICIYLLKILSYSWNHSSSISKLHHDAWYECNDSFGAGPCNGRKWCKPILVQTNKFILAILFGHSVISFKYRFLDHDQGDKARVIQTLLFVAGINTLLQALFGTRLPAVVGGSFSYVIPIAYIVSDHKLQRIAEPHEVSTSPSTPLHHMQCVWDARGNKYMHQQFHDIIVRILGTNCILIY